MVKLAWPIVISAFLAHCINLVGIGFVGRLGEFDLSVALLAVSFFNVTGMAVVVGFAGVLETVCGQAFGAGHYHSVGLALQRAIVLAFILCATITTFWAFIGPVMVLLGQDPVIAAGAAKFLILCSPALFAAALYGVLTRYLLAQGQPRQATVAAVVAAVFAPVYNYLFVIKFGLGLHGAALSIDSVQLTMLGVMVLLTWQYNQKMKGTPQQTWHGWSTAALRGWGAYVRIGLPSVAMVLVEWSSFEVCVLEGGLLPNPSLALAVMGLCLNIATLLYMLPLGMSAACSSRVSNALGAGLPRAAARSAFVAAALAFGMQLCVVTALVLGRTMLVSLLTNVIVRASHTLLIVAAAAMSDGMNCTLNGTLRGSGRQALGACLNITFFWFFALPLGYYLAFHHGLGVSGLWWGLLCGEYLLCTALLIVVTTTDWSKQVERAEKLRSAIHANPILTEPLLAQEAEEEAALEAEAAAAEV